MKILMVEDGKLFQTIVKQFIKQAYAQSGRTEMYQLDIATSQDEAIEMIKKNDYSLITLDGNLAPGYGNQVLEQIDEKNWKKVVAMSTDKFFLNPCREKGIPAFDKNELATKEDAAIKIMSEIINAH